MTKFDHLRGVPGRATVSRHQVWEGARGRRGSGAGARARRGRRARGAARHDRAPHVAVPRPPLGGAARAERRQRVHGWLSDEAILQVAAVMRVTPAYLESIASFYDMLELEPVGRHTIYVCTNISCQLRGAHDVMKAFSEATGSPANGSSPDGEFHLRAFECLGACDIAPMASIEGHYSGPLTPEDARVVAEHLRGGRPASDVLPEQALRRRLRAPRPRSQAPVTARPADPVRAHRRARPAATRRLRARSAATAACARR